MKRRERILTTINHQEPDRVPIGFDIVSPEKEHELFDYYGVHDLGGLYQKTGVTAQASCSVTGLPSSKSRRAAKA